MPGNAIIHTSPPLHSSTPLVEILVSGLMQSQEMVELKRSNREKAAVAKEALQIGEYVYEFHFNKWYTMYVIASLIIAYTESVQG